MPNYNGNSDIVSIGNKTRFASGEGCCSASAAAHQRWALWRFNRNMERKTYAKGDELGRAWIMMQLGAKTQEERLIINDMLNEIDDG